jgi:hypothetical protein
MTRDAKTSLLIGSPARATAAVTAAMLLLLGIAAAAQDSKPDPAAPAATPVHQPGMLEGVGRWFADSFGRFSSNMQAARETVNGLGEQASGAAKEAATAAKGAAGAAKDAAQDAADAMARLPNARVVDGRERCTLAGNGAPDCRQAAEAICRSKGFGSGSSVDIESAQKCSARVWLSRRPSEPGDCEMQSFVTRAVCQ